MREDRDLNQKDIAELLCISQATYSRYEKEELNIPYYVLSVLADFYHTSTDYLLGRTDEIKPYPKRKNT